MTTINADMTAEQRHVPLAATDRDLPSGFYTIGSEAVRVDDELVTTGRGRELATIGRHVTRGLGGTASATHVSGSPLTRYYPEGDAIRASS